MTEFVHLRVHSEYSVADGLVRIHELARVCAERNMPAVALTDRGNLFGLIKFYRACADVGVKPIVGVDLKFRNAANDAVRITALACNSIGYQNLIALVSAAFVSSDEHGMVNRAQIIAHGEGLILLSGARDGEIGRALLLEQDAAARELASAWADAFPDRFYIELQRTDRVDEERYLRAALQLAEELSLPVVATNDVCFLDADDFEAHETRVCIHDGRTLDDPRRERRYSSAQHLRSAEAMAVLFADIPEALANTVEIARRCSMSLQFGEYHLPSYPVPDGVTLEKYIETTAREGLARRLEAIRTLGYYQAHEPTYGERLEYELGVINQMGFSGYFLIVMEFIAWAREQDIPVGPGRGSGAGSLVAYALGITDLDPLHYDLLFERLLNPERVSMPDFDVDFCMEGRDAVINHVSERYGHDAVSQIITFGTMAAKAVVRDVARVQGKPYGLADKLSKLIPFEVGMTLEKAVQQSSDLKAFIDEQDDVGEIMDMAYKLEGIVRNIGRHAGGVVIAPSRLTDFVPLYVDELNGGLVSQYDKDDVELAGLVKFDFLGLKTLTIIDWSVKSINSERAMRAESERAEAEPGDSDTAVESLRIEQIPLDDRAVFERLKDAQTTGVFQLESRGMKELIRGLQPDNINDIIALVALYRPGPLQSGAVEDYINRKHKRAKVTYPHPSLEPVLRNTYGVVLYQEQVMQIAQVLAGFSLGQADLLRRAMGKKKPEEMAKVRAQFLEGTHERGVDQILANEIFDLMEKFAGYAFNKSHSATYAMVSYQTAWLKTHYPAQFMAATLSADMQNIDKIVSLVDEVRRMGVPLTPPSVNLSDYRFTVNEHAVVYGLGAVRGVGAGPVSAIVTARAEGPFGDLSEFCQRVDAKKVNKRVVEALIRSGALDEFAADDESIDEVRGRLLAELNQAIHSAEQTARDRDIGMADMFGGVSGKPVAAAAVVPGLSESERLAFEKLTLGLYLTGHPIEAYLPELSHFCTKLNEVAPNKSLQTVAGLVVSMRTMRSRRGAPMGVVVVDDRSGRIEASMFPEVFEREKHKCEVDDVVVIEGEVQPDDFTGDLKLRVERILTLEEARGRFSRGVTIEFCDANVPGDLAGRLKTLLTPHRCAQSGCAVAVVYQANGAQGRIQLGSNWRVSASDELLLSLKSEFGDDHVKLAYASPLTQISGPATAGG